MVGVVVPKSLEGQVSSRSSVVRWLFEEVWSQGETEALASRIGPLTFHYAGTARRTDGGELALIIDRWREGFPDLQFSVEDLIEQGDRVAVRARLQGTHLGPWRDLPASGRRMDIDVALFFSWEQDQIVEIWEVDDAVRRDQQLKDPSPQ
jgi:predicted ester cyclase